MGLIIIKIIWAGAGAQQTYWINVSPLSRSSLPISPLPRGQGDKNSSTELACSPSATKSKSICLGMEPEPVAAEHMDLTNCSNLVPSLAG